MEKKLQTRKPLIAALDKQFQKQDEKNKELKTKFSRQLEINKELKEIVKNMNRKYEDEMKDMFIAK